MPTPLLQASTFAFVLLSLCDFQTTAGLHSVKLSQIPNHDIPSISFDFWSNLPEQIYTKNKNWVLDILSHFPSFTTGIFDPLYYSYIELPCLCFGTIIIRWLTECQENTMCDIWLLVSVAKTTQVKGEIKLNLATYERAQINFWTKTLSLNNKMCVTQVTIVINQEYNVTIHTSQAFGQPNHYFGWTLSVDQLLIWTLLLYLNLSDQCRIE